MAAKNISHNLVCALMLRAPVFFVNLHAPLFSVCVLLSLFAVTMTAVFVTGSRRPIFIPGWFATAFCSAHAAFLVVPAVTTAPPRFASSRHENKLYVIHHPTTH